jgi:hypothetical protein
MKEVLRIVRGDGWGRVHDLTSPFGDVVYKYDIMEGDDELTSSELAQKAVEVLNGLYGGKLSAWAMENIAQYIAEDLTLGVVYVLEEDDYGGFAVLAVCDWSVVTDKTTRR